MRHVPNFITCLNLFSGCLATVMALNGNYLGAFVFMVLAAIFDFLDGFAARLLKAYSPLGAQLDSLADVISFGLAPGAIVYTQLLALSQSLGFASTLALLGFVIPVFSAIRLAKFNIDTRQTDSFIGLPVPANGLFWASFVLSIQRYLAGNEQVVLVGIVVLILLFSWLMVSELPMFSLKFKKLQWKGNEWGIILIGLSLVLIVAFKMLGVSLIIFTYILLSLIKYFLKK